MDISISFKHYWTRFAGKYPVLADLEGPLYEAASGICSAYEKKGKLLIAGNGGSAADADHIIGELGKGFVLKRSLTREQRTLLNRDTRWGEKLLPFLQQGLPAINLLSMPALNSAFGNDQNAAVTAAQNLITFASGDDLFLGLSTSGNSENIVLAAYTARQLGLRVICMTGRKESLLSELSDTAIRVPADETFEIQEYHLPVYHFLCLVVEHYFFGEEG